MNVNPYANVTKLDDAGDVHNSGMGMFFCMYFIFWVNVQKIFLFRGGGQQLFWGEGEDFCSTWLRLKLNTKMGLNHPNPLHHTPPPRF